MKKKLWFISMAVFLAGAVNAQIKKGSLFLGGDLGGYVQKTKKADETSAEQKSITVSPVYGKAIKDNLVFGANASFGTGEEENMESNWKYETDTYGAGVFLRQYKNVGNSGFYIFVQGSLGGLYGTTEQIQTGYITDIKRYSITASLYPGISYAVSRKLHLETGFNNLLYLQYYNEKKDVNNYGTVTNYKTNGFSLSSSLNNTSSMLYLGFRVLINK